ncbi:MAG: class I SAM-dependent methyltransferase [Acidimicrobiales bacterium]
MTDGSPRITPTIAEMSQIGWFHSIDLGNGVVTSGINNEVLGRPGAYPDVRGRSVLDIGAWDGMYSFKAEQEGAARVVALDHYVWQLDVPKREQYWRECEAAGGVPDPDADSKFLSADELPGRRGFDYAKAALGSGVEPVVADFMATDLDAIGVFDVVLYFGVLYHMLDPFAALRRLRKVTGEVAAIETEAIRVLGYQGSALIGFLGGAELTRDHTNWYVPSDKALHEMCLAAGFGRVETKVGAPPLFNRHVRSRWREGRLLGLVERYRTVVHAFP